MRSLNIPASWASTNLENLLVHVVGGDWGKDVSYEDDDFIPVKCIRGVEFRNWDAEKGVSATLRKVKSSSLENRRLKTGDILIEISGGGPEQPVGRTVLIDERVLSQHPDNDVVCTNFLRLARPSNLISSGFLNAYLRSFYLSGEVINYQGGSNNLRNLKFKEYVTIDIPVPPLAEQKQIAAKLDELLVQVDTIKTRLDAIPAILKHFRQSVLAAAVSGRLTEEWRTHDIKESAKTGVDVILNDMAAKDLLISRVPALAKKKSSLQSDIDTDYVFDVPKKWSFSTWGKISEWITYGFTKPMPKAEDGIKLVTAKDVQNFNLEIDSAGLTTQDAYEGLSEKDRPKIGDLLITKDGSIGRSAIVRTDVPFCINQSVAVCWLRSTSMNKDFLEIVANSDYSQRFVKDKAQGMAIQHLSIIDFAKCPVPVPPREEQTEIVRLVEQLFTIAGQIEQRVKDAQSRVDLLTHSILAKAFRGEITAEWRENNPDLITGDNSAKELLVRIKAGKQLSTHSERARKTRA